MSDQYFATTTGALPQSKFIIDTNSCNVPSESGARSDIHSAEQARGRGATGEADQCAGAIIQRAEVVVEIFSLDGPLGRPSPLEPGTGHPPDPHRRSRTIGRRDGDERGGGGLALP